MFVDFPNSVPGISSVKRTSQLQSNKLNFKALQFKLLFNNFFDSYELNEQ